LHARREASSRRRRGTRASRRQRIASRFAARSGVLARSDRRSRALGVAALSPADVAWGAGVVRPSAESGSGRWIGVERRGELAHQPAVDGLDPSITGHISSIY
jgi:hypothetical protein